MAGKVLVLTLCLFVVIPGPSLAAEQAPDWLEQGRTLIDEGRLDAAIDILERGLATDETNARAHYLLGLALIKKGQHQPALQTIERAHALAPDDSEIHWLLASEYENLGQLDKAAHAYEAIKTSTSDSQLQQAADHRLRYITATRHAQKGDIATARQMFAELVAESPEDLLSLYSLGVAEMLSGLSDAAMATFERVLEQDPGYANAHLNIARIEQARGHLDRAVEHLRKIIEITTENAPERALARTELDLIEAGLLAEGGNLSAALEIYVDITRRQPQETRALVAAARLSALTGDTHQAIDLYHRAIALMPGNPRLRLEVAELELSSGAIAAAFTDLSPIDRDKIDEANAAKLGRLMQTIARTTEGQQAMAKARLEHLDELKRRLAANPKDQDLLREIARIHLQQKEWSQALPYLESLLAVSPNDPWPHIALATTYDQLGRFADAVEQYAWLIMLEPDPAKVPPYIGYLRLALGKALYASGQYRRAAEVFNDVIAANPGDIIAHFYLGLIYTQEDAMLQAIDNYKQIIDLMPSHVGARLNLATAYARLNREEDALAEYRKLLSANPPEEVATLARERIQAIERRIHGLTGTLSYATTYDGNSNLSKTQPEEEIRSDLTLSLDAHYKMRNGLHWRINFKPSYANFHYSQFDFINLAATISADIFYRGTTLLAGLNRRTSRGLITSRRSSESNTAFGEIVRRESLPHLLGFATGEHVPTDLQLDASLTEFQSTSSTFFDARTLSISGEIGQPVGDRTMAHLRYNYVKNNNIELIGSDYAYRSHGLSVRLERGFLDSGVFNIQYRFLFLDYLHADSSTRFTRQRHNTRHSLSLGTNYAIDSALSLFANASWEINDSNLPVGFIINAEDIIEGQQSSSLSDYERGTIGVGIRLTF